MEKTKLTITFTDKDFTKHSNVAFKDLKEFTPENWDTIKKDLFLHLRRRFPQNESYEQFIKNTKKYLLKSIDEKKFKLPPEFKSTLKEDDVRVIIWEQKRLLPFEKAIYSIIFNDKRKRISKAN